MNYKSLEPVIPVTVFDENMNKLYSYASISKTALYTELSAQMITKLVNSKHSKPKWCEKFNRNIFLRKTSDLK